MVTLRQRAVCQYSSTLSRDRVAAAASRTFISSSSKACTMLRTRASIEQTAATARMLSTGVVLRVGCITNQMSKRMPGHACGSLRKGHGSV